MPSAPFLLWVLSWAVMLLGAMPTALAGQGMGKGVGQGQSHGVSLPSASVDDAATSMVRLPDGRMLPPDVARVMQRGYLRVAILNTDTPPFVYEKEGELKGVDIALMQRLSDELKVPVQFDRSSVTYDDVAQLVALGRADFAVSKLARTFKRAQSVQFSAPYFQLEHALLINRLAFADLARQRSVSQTVRDFTGTIAVLGGSAWEEFARRNFPKARIVNFPTWPAAVEAVKKGEVVAAYRDAIEVRKVMQERPGFALTLRTVTFSDLHSSLCVLVGPRSFSLLSMVNEVVASQTERLTVRSLLDQLR